MPRILMPRQFLRLAISTEASRSAKTRQSRTRRIEMNRLSDEYISACRVDHGKILRGENMSRIETFVDAAFAFAFTMLVISIDQIPTNPEELLELSRDIPAFLISAIIIGSIWVTHANWSRHFGLQDSATLYLSLALVMLVLVFVYPIKLMAQATVLYSSGDALGTDIFVLGGWDDNQVAILFIYFGFGLIGLSAILVALYLNALRYRSELQLRHLEVFFCKKACLTWIVVATVAALSCITAFVFYDNKTYVVAAGNLYLTLFLLLPLSQRYAWIRWADRNNKEIP
ncbi:MAG TPA: hypothetical protein DIT42_06230 [Gammaproteobacteria bacterium]|nr:hypothetical protein [Gammaproteobacteria bacterium]